MITKHVLDQLSAYVDGQADDPERIARHLQQCAVCARRHMELSRMSAHVKALPPTEVHPAFLTRVMATLAETSQEPSRRWLSWAATAATAAVAVAVSAAVLYAAVSPRTPRAPEVASVTVPAKPSPVDENALMQQIEERLASGRSTAIVEFDDSDAEADASLAAVLETASDLDRLARANWTNEDDEDVNAPASLDVLDTSLDSLDDSGAAAFKELLNEYARKGYTS